MKSKKVLIDDGVHPTIKNKLSNNSPHRVDSVRNSLGQKVSDPTVVHYADQEDQVVITHDKNFRKVTSKDMSKFSQTLNKTSTHLEINLSGYSFSNVSIDKLRIIKGTNYDDYIVGIGKSSHNGIITYDRDEVSNEDDLHYIFQIINGYLKNYQDEYIHRNNRMIRKI